MLVPFSVYARYVPADEADLVDAQISIGDRAPVRITRTKVLADRHILLVRTGGEEGGEVFLDFRARVARERSLVVADPQLIFGIQQSRTTLPKETVLVVAMRVPVSGRWRFERALLRAFREGGAGVELVPAPLAPVHPNVRVRASAYLRRVRDGTSDRCVLQAVDDYQFRTTPLQRRLLARQEEIHEELRRTAHPNAEAYVNLIAGNRNARLMPDVGADIYDLHAAIGDGFAWFESVCEKFIQRLVPHNKLAPQMVRVLQTATKKMWDDELTNAERRFFFLEAVLSFLRGSVELPELSAEEYDRKAFKGFRRMRRCSVEEDWRAELEIQPAPRPATPLREPPRTPEREAKLEELRRRCSHLTRMFR